MHSSAIECAGTPTPKILKRTCLVFLGDEGPEPWQEKTGELGGLVEARVRGTYGRWTGSAAST